MVRRTHERVEARPNGLASLSAGASTGVGTTTGVGTGAAASTGTGTAAKASGIPDLLSGAENQDVPGARGRPLRRKKRGSRHDLARVPHLARRATSLMGVLIALAIVYALYVARGFMLPIALALLFTALLRPCVALLTRRRIPVALAAAIVMLGGALAAGAAVYYLAGPAADWLHRAPQAIERLEQRVQVITAPLEQLSQAAVRFMRLAHPRNHASPTVEVAESGGGFDLFGMTQEVVAELVMTLILLYFLLASGDFFFKKALAILPRGRSRLRAERCVVEVEKQISVYLTTVTSINFCLGAAASFALWLVGMPNPVLWGALLGLLTYIPYLGPAAAVAIIAAVSLSSMDDLVRAVAAPLVCIGLSATEGYIVTPLVVGRSLALNPVVLFIALAFWSWLWGIVGAVIAVPILVVAKITFDNLEQFAPLGRLLGSYKPGS